MELEIFRLKVANKEPKMKQIAIILECLNFVEAHPEHVSKVGCCWLTDQEFLVNTKIFGIFIGRDPAGINKNFLDNGFNKSKFSKRDNFPKIYNFESIPDPKNWRKRKCICFSKKTTIEEAIKFRSIINNFTQDDFNPPDPNLQNSIQPTSDPNVPIQPKSDQNVLIQPKSDQNVPIQPKSDTNVPFQPNSDPNIPFQPIYDRDQDVYPQVIESPSFPSFSDYFDDFSENSNYLFDFLDSSSYDQNEDGSCYNIFH